MLSTYLINNLAPEERAAGCRFQFSASGFIVTIVLSRFSTLVFLTHSTYNNKILDTYP